MSFRLKERSDSQETWMHLQVKKTSLKKDRWSGSDSIHVYLQPHHNLET
jgi:hypothetical protein